MPAIAAKPAQPVSASDWEQIQQRVEAGESINSVADSVIPGSGRAFREVVRRRCNSEQWAYPHKMGEQIEALKQDRIADNVILGHDTRMDRACAVLLARQGECVVIVSRQEKKRVLLLGRNAKGVSFSDLDVIASFPDGFLDEGTNREGDMPEHAESSPGTYSANENEPLAARIAQISDPVLRREAILAEAVLSELAKNPEKNLPKPRTGSEVRAWLDISRRAFGIEDKPAQATPMLNLTFSSGSGAQPKQITAEVIEPKALD